VVIRNEGAGPATDLVATLSLPPGLTVRPGGAASPDEWQCSGTAAVATCRAAALAAGAEGTIRIKIFVGPTAETGTVTGEVTATGADAVTIPATLLAVQERTTTPPARERPTARDK
jgi:hypothetical protein